MEAIIEKKMNPLATKRTHAGVYWEGISIGIEECLRLWYCQSIKEVLPSTSRVKKSKKASC